MGDSAVNSFHDEAVQRKRDEQRWLALRLNPWHDDRVRCISWPVHEELWLLVDRNVIQP
jgi:hypothetical protein